MEILSRIHTEQVNTNRIHLYPYCHGAWIAYCISAIRLHRLRPNIPCREVDFKKYGVTLPVMIIDSFSLEDLLLPLADVERTERAISIPLPDKERTR